MTLQSEDMGKLVAGQEITVTDFKGVAGPAVVVQADKDGASIDVRFPHTDSSNDEAARYEWFFDAEDLARGGAYGLKLTFEPFRPAHREAQPETDGGGEVDTRLASVVSMLERVTGPTDSVRIYAHEAKVILAALASKGV